MPINAADARQLARVILAAYAEDYATIADILRPLIVQWPSIDWMGALTTEALAHPAFAASGLSVQWWLDEIDRRCA